MRLFWLSIMLLVSSTFFGQYTLETPDGKTVKLHANGTWNFVEAQRSTYSKVNVPTSSTSKYSSKTKQFDVWYNPNKWILTMPPKSDALTWDAFFYSLDYSIQGYCMESRLSLPIATFEESIRQQWESKGEIKSFTSKETIINKLPMRIFEMEYILSNVSYKYMGIIYSEEKGSFQLLVGTQKYLFEEEKTAITLLLMGVTKNVFNSR
jgi:hypothetical protein